MQTPGTITGAVAAGVAPLPLLAVYSVIFLIHGSIKPVQPPDVTSTKQGEFVAGWISLGLLVLFVVALLWLLNGKRRWPAAILQLATLATCVDFVFDPTKGGPLVPALIVITSLISLVLMFMPSAWSWLGRATPSWAQAMARLSTQRTANEDAVEPVGAVLSDPVEQVEPAI